MIINTGARTDTVQFYTKWLLKRFEDGYVLSRNPLFPNKVTRYEMTPDKVDCVVFCSKNYEPILADISKITGRFHTYFHYTITAYGKDIEPGVPTIKKSMDVLKRLSAIVGKQRLAWRYDPVLLTEKYSIQTHLKTFEYMAKELAPYVDRCIFSFVEMYKKLESNMPELIPMTDTDKDNLVIGLGKIAGKYGLYIQTCGTNGDYSQYAVHSSGCMTLDILGGANGILFKELKHKGTRQGCHCIGPCGFGDRLVGGVRRDAGVVGVGHRVFQHLDVGDLLVGVEPVQILLVVIVDITTPPHECYRRKGQKVFYNMLVHMVRCN